MRRSGIVSLTTDFGVDDPYVSQIQAVVIARFPAGRVIDVSHAVPPGDLESALFFTESAWPHFARGTVHVVVVDPGVGSGRPLIAVRTDRAYLVGPDSGVLSSALPTSVRPADGVQRVPPPPTVTAVEISDSPQRLDPVSATFHGRDIMAPVAAALAAGAELDEVGSPIASLTLAPPLAAAVVDGEASGRIIHIDRFGNAITNIRTDTAGPAFELEVERVRIAGPARAYHEPSVDEGAPQALAIGGSSGYLEIAWPDGSAAARLRLRRGQPVRLRRR